MLHPKQSATATGSSERHGSFLPASLATEVDELSEPSRSGVSSPQLLTLAVDLLPSLAMVDSRLVHGCEVMDKGSLCLFATALLDDTHVLSRERNINSIR